MSIYLLLVAEAGIEDFAIDLDSNTWKKRESDFDAFDRFQQTFREKIEDEGMSEEQLYNADESALYLKFLPKRTLTTPDEHGAFGFKGNKIRVTFIPCGYECIEDDLDEDVFESLDGLSTQMRNLKNGPMVSTAMSCPVERSFRGKKFLKQF